MGFNIAGLIFKNDVGNEKELERLLNIKLEYKSTVNFEDATSSSRDENTIDVLHTAHGALVIMTLGEIFDISTIQNEVVQFMVSDVSDTYYFEKYSEGKLDRKYISSMGEVIEDVGDGIVNEENDLMEIVWEIADDYLQNNFSDNMFDLNFKRYEIK
ncbi:hypothetical protein [uncultured Cytophaga sp.]|uniref:hypothetical protein n=1 Tax=uncultured Cytophaga sp. TaxID=160238 RepID=UPI00260B2E60|nr:hypothetical protein [uncultured Cytophaga sp.]